VYFIGIDIGTTHVKTCLLDQNLSIVQIELSEHELHDMPDIGLCFDPDMLWTLLQSQIGELLKRIDPLQVRGIGVTSMAESGLPVDREGRALFPIVPWNDIRSKAYGQELLDKFGGFELYRRTGIIYHPKYSASRMMYLRYEQPEIFARMYCWLSVTDLILNRLCGSFVMDENQACRTLLYNISNHCWDSDLVAAAGMIGKLPQVIRMGESAGTLLPDIAVRFGLSQDVIVVSGGQDHLCAAIAVGDDSSGTVINSMGTSEVYFGLTDSLRLNKETYAACLNQGCFTDGQYYWIANIPGSGASIEWLRQILSVHGDVGYELFSNEDRLNEPSDLFYFPYLNGSGTPHTDHDRKGFFYGLSAATDVFSLIKSIFEGIAFEARWIMDSLQAMGIPVDRILSVGGGTKNQSFIKTKADVLGRPLTIVGLNEATGIGAAMLAARATGLIMNFSRQREEKSVQETIVFPDEGQSRHYQERYADYRRLFDVINSFVEGSK
jgi:xylulokinase